MDTTGVSRRGLLGAGAGLAAGAALTTLPWQPGGGEAEAASSEPGLLLPPERIGLQLYSVRTAVQELGFAKVLETLAGIGYKQIEFAGYTQGTTPEITLKELRGLLDANGLVAAGSHVSPSDDASMKTILDEAEILGIPQVGISMILPSGLPSVSGWRDAAKQFNRYGELAAARGFGFYLHNHFQEWLPCVDDPTRRGMDVLLAETDPRFVAFELDIYWAYVGRSQSGNGFDPLADYAIPQRDRFPLFHVKDGRPSQMEILDVGEGEIDFQGFFTTLFAAAPDQVSKHLYLWERDSADDHPRGALAAARSSYVNMRHGLVGSAAAPAAGLRVTVGAAAVRSRRLRVGLRAPQGATVAATLTRGKRTLATRTQTLAKGRGPVELRLPRSAGAGAAQLTVTVTDGDGTRVISRQSVRL